MTHLRPPMALVRLVFVVAVAAGGALPLVYVTWAKPGESPADFTAEFLEARQGPDERFKSFLIPNAEHLGTTMLRMALAADHEIHVESVVEQGQNAESVLVIQPHQRRPTWVQWNPDPALAAVLSVAGATVQPLPAVLFAERRIVLQWRRLPEGWRVRAFKTRVGAGEFLTSLEPPVQSPEALLSAQRFAALKVPEPGAFDRLAARLGASPPPEDRSVRATGRAGPVVIRVSNLTETGRTGTGAFTLVYFLDTQARLPAGVRIEATDDNPAVLAVEGPDGRDLLRRPLQPAPAGPPGGTSEFVQRVVPLKNLLADVDALHRVRGTVRVLVPEAVEECRLRPLAGSAATAGDVQLRVRAILPPVATLVAGYAEGNRVELAVAAGRGSRAAYWVARDATGVVISGGVVLPLRSVAEVRVPTATAAIDVKVVTHRVAEFPFEFRGLALDNRPPRRIVPATFGPDGPVSVEYAVDRPRGPHWVVTNRSDKTIETVIAEVTYADPAGGTNRWRGSLGRLTAEYSANAPLSVGAGLPPARVARVPTSQVPLPAGATPTGVRAVAVEFVDATTWEAGPSR